VAECDPSGGDLAARFGLSTRSGMTSFALSRRRGMAPATTDEHIQELHGGLEVMVAPVGADSTRALDSEMGALGWPIIEEGCDVIFDCGRLLPQALGQNLILERSDMVFVLATADPSGIANAKWIVDRLSIINQSGHLNLLLRGKSPFSSDDVSKAVGVEVLQEVPEDARASAIACGMPGRATAFARSSLITCTSRLVETIMSAASTREADRGPAVEEALSLDEAFHSVVPVESEDCAR